MRAKLGCLHRGSCSAVYLVRCWFVLWVCFFLSFLYPHFPESLLTFLLCARNKHTIIKQPIAPRTGVGADDTPTRNWVWCGF